jgi:hypothetical protein
MYPSEILTLPHRLMTCLVPLPRGRTVLSRNPQLSRLSYRPSSFRLLRDSHAAERIADGSYMVLNDPRFARYGLNIVEAEPQSIFFRVIEGMSDNFSQPVPMDVTFASAPFSAHSALQLHSNGFLSSPTGKKAVTN